MALLVHRYAMLACILLLATVAYCFSRDEVEIFQLQQELVRKYGSDMNFYQFLKLPKLSESSASEINKNFKKLARKYHPDKNSKYQKLYERINLSSKILMNESNRKIYDYYLKNGFPDYDFKKGGFFFKRVQPKVWFTFLFIYMISGLIHLVLLRLHNQTNKRRIQNFIDKVKEQDSTHGLGECRLVYTESQDSEGRQIIIKSGKVFVVQQDESLAKITTEDIPDPSIMDTLLVKLPKSIWNGLIGMFKKTSSKVDTSAQKGKQQNSTKGKKNTKNSKSINENVKKN